MIERRLIHVSGVVQGVGFRPFVHSLASCLNLAGSVCNQSGDVVIEIEGDRPALDDFLKSLTDQPPRLARIRELRWTQRPPLGDRSFRISASQPGASDHIFFPADVATCEACRRELFDPADRRYRYPFINCTNCGPRLTIITGVPYDRPKTTMAAFEMCPACRREYEDAGDRRFHAQPIACAECGPTIVLIDSLGSAISCDDPIASFGAAVLTGRIGALKGIGGYHLVCDALNQSTVTELRRRKHRDQKPFAIMARDCDVVRSLCEFDHIERELLTSPAAPIVLLRKRLDCQIADAVAPGHPLLGVMLPHTPLHHLLLETVRSPLVMTSGNHSEEPIVYRDDDVPCRLAGIADTFLTHNRAIRIRCDDTVMRVVDRIELPIRRSRGYVPQPIKLVTGCPMPILAVGAQQKVTFALGLGDDAFVSHHLGDLGQFEAYRAFENDVAHYEDLFAVRPHVIAHDLHPEYASSQYAVHRARREGFRLVAVQHHHAHIVSCMTENALSESVIGVAFDGTGYGTDGAVWGGEFLVGDAGSFQRAAHLRYVGLPGGEQAIRQPWRIAVAHLLDADCDCPRFSARQKAVELQAVRRMLERGINSPPTSSMGRLFDAVACLSGGRDHVSYEGQAAVELEWLASEVAADRSYPFTLIRASSAASTIVDTRPLIEAVVGDVAANVSRERVARRFHSTIVDIIVTVCRHLKRSSGLDHVALSGGVFMNELLLSEATIALSGDGFQVFRHRTVPPNDGGLSLGQIGVAAAQLRCGT